MEKEFLINADKASKTCTNTGFSDKVQLDSHQIFLDRKTSTKTRKGNVTTIFIILFVLFLMVAGITIGITYSAFQNAATSNGAITFAVNGHQGKIVVDNARVETYNNGSDITTQFTLKPDIGFAVVNSVSCELYSDNYVTKYATYTASPASANTEATQGALTYSYDNNGIGTLKLSNLLLAGDNNFSVLKIVGSATGGTYTITYNKNGGSGGTNSQTATFGADMPTIALPTRTGYAFDGYTTNADGTGAKYYDGFGATPRQWDRASNTTLYARWIQEEYTIILDNQGADAIGSTFVKAKYGSTLPSVKVPTKDFCVFDGYWNYEGGIGSKYYNADGTSSFVYNRTSDMTLYAKWMGYVEFVSPTNSIAISTRNSQKNWDGTIEYCLSKPTNSTIWNVWDGTTSIGNVSRTIYMRGLNCKKLGGASSSYSWEINCAGDDVSCNGNLMNLINCTKTPIGQSITMNSYAFGYLFCDNTSLIYVQELSTPILSQHCCYNMFSGCFALVKAPDLPATTLASSCYSDMFKECYSLVVAPDLPATTLTTSCYYAMFKGCVSLTYAPVLPATILAQACYYMMFDGCTSLTQAPALPATTLANHCYFAMFKGCINLHIIPALPALNLPVQCYVAMFEGCYNVKVSTTQNQDISLNEYRIPISGTGSMESDSLNNMFFDTRGTFSGTPNLNTTYYVENKIINPDGTITPLILSL